MIERSFSNHFNLFFLLLFTLMVPEKSLGGGLADNIQPVLAAMNPKVNDMTFLVRKNKAWLNLPDLFNRSEQEQHSFKGILQLELDTETSAVTATVKTPDPSAALPEIIILPSVPRVGSPLASGTSYMNETPILQWLNGTVLDRVRDTLETIHDQKDSNIVQYRTHCEASVTPIPPEEKTTPHKDPTNPNTDEKICILFENEPFSPPFAVYVTDEDSDRLNIEVNYGDGSLLTISPSPTTKSDYQSATLIHKPRQVPTESQQGSSAAPASNSAEMETETGSDPCPQQTNNPSILGKRSRLSGSSAQDAPSKKAHFQAETKKLQKLMVDAVMYCDYFTVQKLLEKGLSPTEEYAGQSPLERALSSHACEQQRISDRYKGSVLMALHGGHPYLSTDIHEIQDSRRHQGIYSTSVKERHASASTNTHYKCCNAQKEIIELLLSKSLSEEINSEKIFNAVMQSGWIEHEEQINRILDYIESLAALKSSGKSQHEYLLSASSLFLNQFIHSHNDPCLHDFWQKGECPKCIYIVRLLCRRGFDYKIFGYSKTMLIRAFMNQDTDNFELMSDIYKIVRSHPSDLIELGSVADIFLGQWEDGLSYAVRKAILESSVEKNLNIVLWKGKPLLNMFITEASKNDSNTLYAGLYHLVAYGLVPVFYEPLNMKDIENCDYSKCMYKEIRKLQVRLFQHKPLAFLVYQSLGVPPELITKYRPLSLSWNFRGVLREIASESKNTPLPVVCYEKLPLFTFPEEESQDSAE